ncbi:hypothetical protein ACRRTK_000629 [Alexandromys fortis]
MEKATPQHFSLWRCGPSPRPIPLRSVPSALQDRPTPREGVPSANQSSRAGFQRRPQSSLCRETALKAPAQTLKIGRSGPELSFSGGSAAR